MAPGPVPKTTDIVVAPRNEIAIDPKLGDGEITPLTTPRPGVDLYLLGGDNPVVEGLNGPNLTNGTLGLLGDSPMPTGGTDITPAPSSSNLSLAGGIIAGLSVFLGGCSGSPVFAAAPALVVVTALSIYAIGRAFKGATAANTSETTPKQPAEFAREARIEAPAEILQELLSPELAELRARSEWDWYFDQICNTENGVAVWEDNIIGLVATGGSLTETLQNPQLKTKLTALSKQSPELAEDVKEFRAQSKVVLDRYAVWEGQMKEYAKLPAGDPHKSFALADLHTRWFTEVQPEINKLKETDFFKAHRVYDEALEKLETSTLTTVTQSSELNAIETALILEQTKGVALDYKTVTKKPEELPFEEAALKKLPETDLIVLEIIAPTKSELLKIEYSLKKQGLLPSPVAISFKTADGNHEEIWLPERAIEDKPLIGWNKLLMKKKEN